MHSFPRTALTNDDKLAGSKWQDSVLTILENRSLRSVHLQARLLYIQASVPPGLFLLLMAPDNPWWSLAYRCIAPVSASVIPWPPRVSVCLNFPYFIRIPLIGLGSILTQDDLVLT